MYKTLFASLLLFSTLGGMKKVPEWTEKDFQLARRLIKVLNAVEDLKVEVKKQIIESEENMKKFLEEEIEKLTKKDTNE